MPGAERITAVGHEAGEFQNKKRTGRHKDDRNETHVTQQTHHAATPLIRLRVRSANACAAATIVEVSAGAAAAGRGSPRGRGARPGWGLGRGCARVKISPGCAILAQ